jgi:RNA polymerase sigma-70 factor, ECF subfamily
MARGSISRSFGSTVLQGHLVGSGAAAKLIGSTVSWCGYGLVMAALVATTPSPDELLRAALAGDQASFHLLVEPHIRALHVHCYRMLGSFHDAEDATQETLLRAWRFLSTFQGRGSLRAWLYRIATTTCLKAIQARRPHGADGSDVPYLEPYPDRLLDDLPADGPDPAAVAEQRTSVALAFVAALQRLTARQRAVLLLRDVLDWKASEVAGLLETSVPAVNSALQRARASLGRAAPLAAVSTRSLNHQDRVVLDRFVEAWQRRDIDGLVGLLREDAVLHMPPLALRYVGREQITGFLRTVPAEGRLDRIRLLATRANGQPAVAAYLPSDGGLEAYGVMVLTVAGEEIQAITGFQDPSLFAAFGLPQTRPR